MNKEDIIAIADGLKQIEDGVEKIQRRLTKMKSRYGIRCAPLSIRSACPLSRIASIGENSPWI